MILIGISSLLAIGVIVYILRVRPQDLPKPEPPSPFEHLDERKAAIYENLRDLQFEYRVGKLSDEDYQQTKQDLQKELARVLAEVDKLKLELAGSNGALPPPPTSKAPADANVCPSCGAKFKETLKFCGECGKPMKVEKV